MNTQQKDSKYKAVFFDFDYTLANSERGIVSCFHKVFDTLGVTVDDYKIKRTIGLPIADEFRILLGIEDEQEIEELRKLYVSFADTFMTPNTVLYAGVKELIGRLREAGITVGILSSKTSQRIDETLNRDGLTVDALYGVRDVVNPKPDPEGLNKALAELKLKRGELLYVGDAAVDAAAARNAGVDFVGVAQGSTTREELQGYPHVAVVNQIAEVTKLIFSL